MLKETGLLMEHPIANLLFDENVQTWREAVEYVARLPYGRLSQRDDFLGVLRHRRGTCSLKHGLLFLLAQEQKIDARLMTGLFEMNATTNPKTGSVLASHHLESILEAHCYLLIDGTRLDATTWPITTLGDGFILKEREITAAEIVDVKPAWHRAQLEIWATSRGLDAETAWDIREQCIEALSQPLDVIV